MGMTKVYSVQTNIHNNAAESDNIDDVLKWVKENIESWPLRTIINIRVNEMPTELFISLPKFEGFQYGNAAVETPGSD
jgi:hypothetical protein